MASPPLHWKNRQAKLSKDDCLSSGKSILKKEGLTDIKVSSTTVSGKTSTVHAAIGIVKKQDPQSPGPGLGTTEPPVQILFFFAAGTGANKVLDGIVARWDNLKFL